MKKFICIILVVIFLVSCILTTNTAECYSSSSCPIKVHFQTISYDISLLVEDTISTIDSFEEDVIYEITPEYYATYAKGFYKVASENDENTTVSMLKLDGQFWYSIEDICELIPDYAEVNLSLTKDGNDIDSLWIKESPFTGWRFNEFENAYFLGYVLDMNDEHFVNTEYLRHFITTSTGVAVYYGKVYVLEDISKPITIFINIPETTTIYLNNLVISEEPTYMMFVAALWIVFATNLTAYNLIMENCKEVVLSDRDDAAGYVNQYTPSKIFVARRTNQGIVSYISSIAAVLVHEATHLECFKMRDYSENYSVPMEILSYYRFGRELDYIGSCINGYLNLDKYRIGAKNALEMMKLIEPEYFSIYQSS